MAANKATGIIERSEEDSARAGTYRLLARFLASPPDAETLAIAASLGGDAGAYGRSTDALARVARVTTPVEAREEYDRLFIGLVRGELVPYASFYLTGFLYERPLAALRADLNRLGIARSPGCSDPEDHIASMCEAMAGLIEGIYGSGTLAAQQSFFDSHLGPWAPQFFADLERARSSRLYGPVGTLGRVYMEIEATAFAMAA